MVSYKNSTPVKCEVCGETRHPINMEKHQQTRVCQMKGKASKMLAEAYSEKQARGLVKLSHAGFLATLEEAGIKAERGLTHAAFTSGEHIYTCDGWWVPDWVEAIVSARNVEGSDAVRVPAYKRVKALKMALMNEEFKNALHALLLMTPDRGADAVTSMLKQHKSSINAQLRKKPGFSDVASEGLPI